MVLCEDGMSRAATDVCSALQGNFDIDCSALPAIMRPHASALAEIRAGQGDTIQQLKALYTSLIWDVLQQQRIGLLVDDMDKADNHSMDVMVELAATVAASTALPGQQREARPAGVLLCTAESFDNLLPGGQPPHSSADSIAVLRLKPLAADAVLQIACSVLGCSQLAPSIASMIVGEMPVCRPLPVHVQRALCLLLRLAAHLTGQGIAAQSGPVATLCMRRRSASG